MTDMALLIAQAVVTGCMAAWMVTGVFDNWRHPHLNLSAVAMVTRFDRMAEDFPQDFEVVKHRRVSDMRVIRGLFYLLVAWETVAAITLVGGTVALVMALGGAVDVELARLLAVLGALAFTVNWAGFLAGGNYFCYWYCHFAGQATHFMLLIWGILGTILLVIPG
ncbi:MAG: DUF2165 family protein [Pseudomonadota bacterium]